MQEREDVSARWKEGELLVKLGRAQRERGRKRERERDKKWKGGRARERGLSQKKRES